MNTAIMVPARAGSKRVPIKNLRLLSGKPLLGHILDTLSGIGLPVHVNSESERIHALVAEYPGVTSYRRPEHLAGDQATNDDFMLDFLEQHPDLDCVIQVLPTSPFLTADDIRGFVERMQSGEVDTLISVKNVQIGAVFEGRPINFDRLAPNPPSQTMIPVQAYATALMGWRRETFLDHHRRLGCAYHGGDGRIGYHPLTGFATVDVDTEEDFLLAETIAQFLPFKDRYRAFYWEPSYTDYVVPRVMHDDGVHGRSPEPENQEVVSVTRLMAEMPQDRSWYRTLVNTENNSCTIVNQMPGEGNRRHFHAKWNEWWYILRGQWRFEIDGEDRLVGAGDLVFIAKGRRHRITAVGEGMASRLAVSRYDVEHIYESPPPGRAGQRPSPFAGGGA